MGWSVGGRVRSAAGSALAAAAIFGAATVFRVSVTDDGVSLWHPQAAITLLVLVVGGARRAPLVVAARVAAAMIVADTDRPFLELLFIVAAVVLPYVAAAAAVRRWFRVSIRRAGLRDVCWTLGLCGIAAPILAGTAWLASRVVIGDLPEGTPLWRSWLAFVVGDAVAILGLVPGTLIGLAHAHRLRTRGVRFRVAAAVEAAVTTAAIVGTFVLAVHATYDLDVPLLYLTFVPMLWVALRHGLSGTAAAALVGTVTTVTLLHTRDVGPTAALQVQAFLVVVLGATYGVGAEVSDRRRAEAATRTAEIRFRSAFDRSIIGMALIGIEPHNMGRFLQVNDALSTMLGRSPEELMRLTVAELTHPDDHIVGREALGTLEDGNETVELAKRYLHADGHEIWCRVRAGVVTDHAGRLLYSVSQIEDVTFERLRLQRLSYEASHDRLTRLLNRFGFGEQTRDMDLQSSWTPLLYIDLDLFKLVNDTLGHAAGDDVLVAVADRLRESVRTGDLVGRMGGDEFVVLAAGTFTTEIAARAAALTLAERIDHRLTGLDAIAGGLPVAASVGITVGPPGSTLDDLLRDADHEMLKNKQARRSARPNEIDGPEHADDRATAAT
jgi:diguanylate cyclase (GGDEF)-like protein/PAS domain S-box-containing protein